MQVGLLISGRDHSSIFTDLFMSPISSPIIWQNEDATVTLIDVPRSIGDAQCSLSSEKDARHLLSVTPLQSPYPSTEPKSNSARARVASINGSTENDIDRQHQHLLREALKEVRHHVKSDWCHPRLYTKDNNENSQTGTNKRKRREENEAARDTDDDQNEYSLMALTGSRTIPQSPDVADLASRNASLYWTRSRQHTESREEINDVHNYTPFNNFLSNTSDSSQLLTISNMFQSEQKHTYHFPPRSAFSLSDCNDPEAFRTALESQHDEGGSLKRFDFILLDPPWPNRSVRRTHQTPGSTYSTPQTVKDVRDLLINTGLETVISDDCLVGIWITNKSAVRDCLLDRDNGLFAECHWDLKLVEEWLWLKTTVHGEPVGELESVWRRPYEILLLGRRRRRGPAEDIYGGSTASATIGSGSSDDNNQLRRRVLLAVPDLHSRKPCLKRLIEPLMPDPHNYRALEIFARNLVAGWWSWGNECIKFNWEGYWRESSDMSEEAEDEAKAAAYEQA